MKKTSVYLEPELDRALADLATARGLAKAELIRQVLRAAVPAAERPRVRAIGVARGPGDVAADVDRHLRETGFGT